MPGKGITLRKKTGRLRPVVARVQKARPQARPSIYQAAMAQAAERQRQIGVTAPDRQLRDRASEPYRRAPEPNVPGSAVMAALAEATARYRTTVSVARGPVVALGPGSNTTGPGRGGRIYKSASDGFAGVVADAQRRAAGTTFAQALAILRAGGPA